MSVWIHILVFAAASLAARATTCPDEWFSAEFTAIIDQSNDKPLLIYDDPELSFFTDYMLFRDEAIQHTTYDAINFFNESYGLDFSDSAPNEQNERFFQNAKMSPFILPPDKSKYILTSNRWAWTGSTRSQCYLIRDGGFQVRFSGDQTLRGSYGGTEGKPAGPYDLLLYGFYNIDVCQQSPLIIQYQSGTPFRAEPNDQFLVINCDLYNRVLGHGKAQGVARSVPIPDEPGQFHIIVRSVFTFPIRKIT